MSGYNDLIKNAAKISQKPIDGNSYNKRPEQVQPEKSADFNSVLKDKLSEINSLQFSKHAAVRLSTRAISLSDDQLKRVESGIANAGQKGIKDSLVLVDDLALLVNIPSKTVITAINQNNQNVFTNIDGAVIV